MFYMTNVVEGTAQNENCMIFLVERAVCSQDLFQEFVFPNVIVKPILGLRSNPSELLDVTGTSGLTH